MKLVTMTVTTLQKRGHVLQKYIESNLRKTDLEMEG